jgi:HAD superfamily hydrolase (TIGR01544 family)
MQENIVISNKKELEKIKKSISEGGTEKLHVLADFDRTLTTAFVDGKSVPSLISVMRDNNYLSPDYAAAAQELYLKYHPIEINPEIPIAEKKKAMKEWWVTHYDLLIKFGFRKEIIEKIVNSGKVRLRQGSGEFFDFLKSHHIPLVIMSSGGLGNDTIPMFLKKEGKLSDNIFIISNSFQWDKEGRAVAVNYPIIHTMNKDETMVHDFPAVFEKIKNRKNVLLLGDTLGDIGMVQGFDCDNLLKIGFLNEAVEENLEEYKCNFDVIILNDSSMDYINGLLKQIIK